MRIAITICLLYCMTLVEASAQDAAPHWVTAWTGSAQGPYPSGNPSAQPDMRMAFPDPAAGARDQSFRLILRPSIWGPRTRLRFSNAFGTAPLALGDVFVGLQAGAAQIVSGSQQAVRFGGGTTALIPPGSDLWSDPVALPFAQDLAHPLLEGRKLAVSFHVAGSSGPMTWHAKALQTSYVSYPGAGSRSADEGESGFPLTTASWYFLDAVDMAAGPEAFTVVCFGDSITDGTLSTLNGDDRWPDVLSRRLRAQHGNRVAVANAGIGGNQVAGPLTYSPDKPFPGGPASGQRLQRDVLSLSGVGAVIWLEGINDFSKNGNAATATVIAALREGVARLREGVTGLRESVTRPRDGVTRPPEGRRGVRVIGATLPPALGSTIAAHGSAEQDAQRRELNAFIRTSGLFDAVIDFDAVVADPATSAMRPAYVHNTTIGGDGDKLHPNRLGYLDMGSIIDLQVLMPR